MKYIFVSKLLKVDIKNSYSFRFDREVSWNIPTLRQHQNSPLQWRDNDYDGVSNHQPHGYLLNRLFRCRSKKTSKLRVTGLCAGNLPGPVNSPHKGPVTRKMFPCFVQSEAANQLAGRSHILPATLLLSCLGREGHYQRYHWSSMPSWIVWYRTYLYHLKCSVSLNRCLPNIILVR